MLENKCVTGSDGGYLRQGSTTCGQGQRGRPRGSGRLRGWPTHSTGARLSTRAAPRLSLLPRPELRPQPSDRTPPASATYTFSEEAQSSLSIESASCCRRASSLPTSCPEREGGRCPSGGHGDPGTDRRRPRPPAIWLLRTGRHLPKEDSARHRLSAWGLH